MKQLGADTFVDLRRIAADSAPSNHSSLCYRCAAHPAIERGPAIPRSTQPDREGQEAIYLAASATVRQAAIQDESSPQGKTSGVIVSCGEPVDGKEAAIGTAIWMQVVLGEEHRVNRREMREWLVARVESTVGVILVLLVGAGTIVLTPVVASGIEQMPWLLHMHGVGDPGNDGEPSQEAPVREYTDPLPFEFSGLTGEELIGLGIPVKPTPVFYPVDDSERPFPAGHYVTEAGNQTVFSDRRALWIWDAADQGMGVEIRIVELASARWAESLARIWAEEPAEGLYPQGAFVSFQSAELDDGPFERARVAFTHDRLWIVAQIGTGPAYQAAVDAGKAAPLDTVNLAREIALATDAELPPFDDMAGWETLWVEDLRPVHAASLGIAAALAILARNAGPALLDNGSREALAGLWLRRRNRVGKPRDDDVDLTNPARRIRTRAFLETLLLALAAGAGMILLYFVASPVGLTPAFLIAGGIVLIISVMNTVLRQRGRSDSDLGKGWHRAEVAATAASSLVLTAGIWCVGVAGIGFASGDAELLRILSFVMLGVGLCITGFAVYPPRLLHRFAMPAVKRALAEDDRAQVLLLRSFQDDDIQIRIHPSSRQGISERIALLADSTFEDHIAWVASRVGPVIAIGQPGTKLQPLGAVRDYFDDDNWQSAVLKRINTSIAVIFVVGRSPGAQWELAQLRDRGALAKTVFVFPPLGMDEFMKRSVVLADGLCLRPTEFFGDIDTPAPLAAVRIGESGQVIRYLVDGRDDIAYSIAIKRALQDAIDARATIARVGDETSDPEVSNKAAQYLESYSPLKRRKKSSDPFVNAARFFIDLSRQFF